MKLNPDCIRSLLIAAEERTGFSTFMRYSPNDEIEVLEPYSKEEILYHINQCELSGLFTEVSWFFGGECLIHDISPYGHEFLANIRSDTVWNKTKETAKKVGSFSIDTLSKIAVGVVTAIIKENI